MVGIVLLSFVPFSCLNDLDERDLNERNGDEGGSGGTSNGASGESDGSGGTSGAGKGGSGKGGSTSGSGADAGETGSGGSSGDDGGAGNNGSGASGGSSAAGGSGGAAGSGGTGGATAGTGGDGMGAMAGSGGSAGVAGSSGNAGSAGTGGPPGTNFDCSANPGGAIPGSSIPPIKLTPIATATRPVQLKAAPGDDTRLFVVEHRGRIRVIKDGTLLTTPFLDLTSLVKDPGGSGEHGMLGVAFHPEYASNGRFFVSYNAAATGNVVVQEYLRSNDPDVGNPSAVATLLDQAKAYPNHNGGALEFSPSDGFLYIGVGDGGGSGDPMQNAQALDVLLGKILRVDVNSGTPYSIPAGNYTDAGSEIWAIGVRNPWRFTFDPCHGDLYLADTGQSSWEEINVVHAGRGDLNFGWNAHEGKHCFTTGCVPDGFTMPLHEYEHDASGGAVIGGYVYRGSAIPGLRGYYVFGDFSKGTFGAFGWDRATDAASSLIDLSPNLGTLTNISSFGQDNDGELYVLSVNGSVNRIDPE